LWRQSWYGLCRVGFQLLARTELEEDGHMPGETSTLPSAPPRNPFNPSLRTDIRWGWILAIALGCFLGLLTATWLGETGASLGVPDRFDVDDTL